MSLISQRQQCVITMLYMLVITGSGIIIHLFLVHELGAHDIGSGIGIGIIMIGAFIWLFRRMRCTCRMLEQR